MVSDKILYQSLIHQLKQRHHEVLVFENVYALELTFSVPKSDKFLFLPVKTNEGGGEIINRQRPLVFGTKTEDGCFELNFRLTSTTAHYCDPVIHKEI